MRRKQEMTSSTTFRRQLPYLYSNMINNDLRAKQPEPVAAPGESCHSTRD